MSFFPGSGSPKDSSITQWLSPLIVSLVLALDQVSKALALYFLSDYPSIPVIPNIFHFTLVHNTGIAFGLFHGGRGILVTAICLGIGVLFYLAYQMRHESIRFRVSLGFILGGALGNLTDRLIHGAVIDFLDFRIWPVFNLADSFITAGVFILVLSLLKKKVN